MAGWRGERGRDRARDSDFISAAVYGDCGCSVDTLWQKNVRQSECAPVAVRKFLEDEKAYRVLGSEKVLPMQVRVQVKDGCKALTA
jgi:hypothetical protein